MSTIALPTKFTYPFCYDPHPIAIKAAEQLQDYLRTQDEWKHNFGLDPSQSGSAVGKMFGVLVVQDSEGQLAFLAAYSGKLAESNNLPYFVPPIYDTLDPQGFYKKGEAELNRYNREIELLENNPEYALAKSNLDKIKEETTHNIQKRKEANKANKKDRKRRREANAAMPEEKFEKLLEGLAKESIQDSYILKDMIHDSKEQIQSAELKLGLFEDEIQKKKNVRRALSSSLQTRLHKQYRFLNADGNTADLLDIFEHTTAGIPPAGSGECAAPKLLQYAYEHGMMPIALAEFWWGVSPKSEVRNHKHYYPACRGKCLPILTHMMQGLDVDDNPLLITPPLHGEIEVLYEDDYVAILNKPHEFLSVPGRNIQDSVLERMKGKYPDATGPLLVHRLDMSTSGILIMAKDMRSHRILQQQFIKKTIQKRYVAVLDGIIEEDSGYIDLPLRVDLDDRPRQMVCYEHGKSARTRFEVISRSAGQTRVHFYPITGRTHQLRVHAAHPLGLASPIAGDDLYGKKADRLHLHAEHIIFQHPETKQMMNITCVAPF